MKREGAEPPRWGRSLTCLIPEYFSVIILSMSLSNTMLTCVCRRTHVLYNLSVKVLPGIPDRKVWSAWTGV